MAFVFSRVLAFALLVSVATQVAVAEPAKPLSQKAPESEIWQDLSKDMYGDKPILNGDGLMSLEAPYRALDAAIVPIGITFKNPQTANSYVKAISLVIDENPGPVAAVFYPSPQNPNISFSTRVRVEAYTHVRAIAEMSDGKVYMVEKFVKAAGGCSAPALDDMEAANKRMGKMKFTLLPSEQKDLVKAKFMMSHPNYSGLQFNQITRSEIPAHFVSEISIKKGEVELLRMEGGISLSENPTITFYYPNSFEPKGKVQITAQDSEENNYSWEG